MESGGRHAGQPGPATLEGRGLSVAQRNSKSSQGLLASQDQCRSFLLPTVAKEASEAFLSSHLCASGMNTWLSDALGPRAGWGHPASASTRVT